MKRLGFGYLPSRDKCERFRVNLMQFPCQTHDLTSALVVSSTHDF
jgi:hypothetical protein